jgi:nucleoside-triphosphatase THEP1
LNTELSTVCVITGDIGTGKSTLAARLSQVVRERGFKVGGIIAHRRTDCPSGACEYWTECLLSGKQFLFATTRQLLNSCPTGSVPLRSSERGRRASACQLGRFYFPRAAIWRASRCLRQSAHCDYVFIDELGPLELARRGLWRATQFLLKNSRARLILVIRRPLLNPVLSALHAIPRLTLDTATAHSLSFSYFVKNVLAS